MPVWHLQNALDFRVSILGPHFRALHPGLSLQQVFSLRSAFPSWDGFQQPEAFRDFCDFRRVRGSEISFHPIQPGD